MNKKTTAKFSFLFFVIGLILLFFLIDEVGSDLVLNKILELKWRIVYVLLFPATWYSVQSYAWWRILADDGVKVSLWHVFLTKITGEAVNTVTPISFVGGDPYRIYLLQKKTTKTESAASVVIDRTMYILAVVLLLLTSLVGALLVLPLPGAWKVLFPLITLGLFGVFVFLVFFQKKGMFGSLSRLLQKIGIQKKKLNELSEKIDNLDEKVGGFYRKHKLHFFEIMFLQYLGRFLGVIEIYIIVSLLGLPVSFVQCLFLASLTVLINLSFFFVPGSMGVMESGYGALFYLLKLNPAYGVAIQLVRRIRTFFWIGLGLLIILVYRPSASPVKKLNKDSI